MLRSASKLSRHIPSKIVVSPQPQPSQQQQHLHSLLTHHHLQHHQQKQHQQQFSPNSSSSSSSSNESQQRMYSILSSPISSLQHPFQQQQQMSHQQSQYTFHQNINNNNNNNYYKSQSSRVVEQQHDDTGDTKHIDTYSSIMNTHQQEDEYNNFNNKKRKNKKKWFRLGMGALMIGGIMVGYARWYVHCLHDYNEQVNHIYMNHESQFIEQALRTALDTLNSDEHLTYLLNNVFQQCGSNDKSDKNSEYRIQMIPLSDLLLNNDNNNNNSDNDNNGNGNSSTTSMVSDSIIYSDFKVQYSLLPDLCQMKTSSTPTSTIHNNHSNNNRHSSGFVIDKCHTVVQSRECTLNFYFLIAPTNNTNNNTNSNNNGNNHVDRNAIVKVTMKSLDYPNRDLFNRVIHHTNHTIDIHNMMIAANHMNGDGDDDDEMDNVNLSTVPNYYITRISVCQTDKLLPQLLMSSSSSLSANDDDEEHHQNKKKKNKKHWTMDPLSPSNVPPSPQLLLVNHNNSSYGNGGSDAVDSAQERLHVQHKLHMGGEVILEKASSIGGMIKGREGIKNVCHCYEKRRRCSLAQHFMS